MEKKWLCASWLIIVSALLGVLPFLFTHFFAECIFIFLVPLYYLVITHYELKFKEGFLWGLIFYSLYFFGIFVLIMQHGDGSYRFFAGIALVLYGALGAGCWFFLCYSLACFFSYYLKNISITKIACWIVGSWFYFWFVDRAFFSIFGFFEGDQLRFLLLPLAVRPQWLLGVKYVTRLGGLLLVLIFSASIACLLIGYKKKLFFMSALLCSLPFAAGWFYISIEHKELHFLSTIACLIPPIEQNDPWLAHEHICELLTKCSFQPTIKTIIFPESAFQFPLQDWARHIPIWYKCLGKGDTYIVLGSHRRDNLILYNSMYVLRNRRIINYYDKIHSMFFTERIPCFWSNVKGIKNLFLKNKSPFCQGRKKRSPIFFPILGFIHPYICSDLFFEPVTTSIYNDTNTLLCMVNDSWFSVVYIPELMFLHAISKAIFENCSILYISYTKNECIFYDGFLKKLLTIR